LTCSVPRRQPHHDPWAKITPTVVFAAALETSSPAASSTGGSRRRRDASRHVADNRAEFLAAREARLASAHVEKRGLDNSTVTVTELDTAKWATSTVWSTALATTITSIEDSTQSVTTTTTQTVFSGVTKVVVTVTAVSFESGDSLSGGLTLIFVFAAHAHQDKGQVHDREGYKHDHAASQSYCHDQVGACVEHGNLQC
jgi:hypothetical protein